MIRFPLCDLFCFPAQLACHVLGVPHHRVTPALKLDSASESGAPQFGNDINPGSLLMPVVLPVCGLLVSHYGSAGMSLGRSVFGDNP